MSKPDLALPLLGPPEDFEKNFAALVKDSEHIPEELLNHKNSTIALNAALCRWSWRFSMEEDAEKRIVDIEEFLAIIQKRVGVAVPNWWVRHLVDIRNQDAWVEMDRRRTTNVYMDSYRFFHQQGKFYVRTPLRYVELESPVEELSRAFFPLVPCYCGRPVDAMVGDPNDYPDHPANVGVIAAESRGQSLVLFGGSERRHTVSSYDLKTGKRLWGAVALVAAHDNTKAFAIAKGHFLKEEFDRILYPEERREFGSVSFTDSGSVVVFSEMFETRTLSIHLLNGSSGEYEMLLSTAAIPQHEREQWLVYDHLFHTEVNGPLSKRWPIPLDEKCGIPSRTTQNGSFGGGVQPRSNSLPKVFPPAVK